MHCSIQSANKKKNQLNEHIWRGKNKKEKKYPLKCKEHSTFDVSDKMERMSATFLAFWKIQNAQTSNHHNINDHNKAESRKDGQRKSEKGAKKHGENDPKGEALNFEIVFEPLDKV